MRIERKVNFGRSKRNRKVVREGRRKRVPKGRVPRVSKIMALAIKMEKLLHKGEVTNYAELARLGHVHRSRIPQIMMLLNLAPDIQEQLLFLPRVENGPDPIIERDVRGVAKEMDWGKQRVPWKSLFLSTKNLP